MTKFKQYLFMLFSLVLSCLMIIAVSSCKVSQDVVDDNSRSVYEWEKEPEANERINITVTTANNSNITIKKLILSLQKKVLNGVR